MEYCIGKPGQSPRMILDANEEQARAQITDGEVCFAQSDIPPAPHVIAQDGASVVALAIDPATVERDKWNAIKQRRNGLLNTLDWTFRRDSPLSLECQEDWLGWAHKLNRLTYDYKNADDVIWPDLPSQEY